MTSRAAECQERSVAELLHALSAKAEFVGDFACSPRFLRHDQLSQDEARALVELMETDRDKCPFSFAPIVQVDGQILRRRGVRRQQVEARLPVSVADGSVQRYVDAAALARASLTEDRFGSTNHIVSEEEMSCDRPAYPVIGVRREANPTLGIEGCERFHQAFRSERDGIVDAADQKVAVAHRDHARDPEIRREHSAARSHIPSLCSSDQRQLLVERQPRDRVEAVEQFHRQEK